MHHIFDKYLQLIDHNISLTHNVTSFLNELGHKDTAEHCLEVAEQAKQLAFRFEVNPESAYISGLLHDISVIFPNEVRIEVSRQLGIEVLPEEESFPMIIHQKISKVMANELFQVRDPIILNAIECHTTLKNNSTILDKVLFVADKISWDQQGIPPYLQSLNEQLNISLDHGAFAYVNYLWERRETLKVIHPWLNLAYHELSTALKTVSPD